MEMKFTLGHEKSEEIYNFLVEEEYIDEKGSAKDRLKIDLKENVLKLPQEFEYIRASIEKKLKSSAGKLVIKNADDKQQIQINKEVFIEQPHFKELWDKIKYKTTYQVNFDGEKLKEKCIENIDNEVYIPSEKFLFEKKRLAITKGGIEEGF